MSTDGKPVIMEEDFSTEKWDALRKRSAQIAALIDPAPFWGTALAVEPRGDERVWPSEEAMERTSRVFRAAALRIERARLMRVLAARDVLRGTA